MSNPQILPDTRSAISLPGSVCGPSPCAELGGLTTAQFGRALVPADLSARQAKAAGLLTSGICGPLGSISSPSAHLASSLGSKLKRQYDMAGSTLFKLTWKVSATPLGRPVSLLRASARRTSAPDCGSWPTPTTRDWKDGAECKNVPLNALLGRVAWLAGWPTPMAGTPAQNGNNPAGNNDSSRKTVALCGWPTPSASDGNGGEGFSARGVDDGANAGRIKDNDGPVSGYEAGVPQPDGAGPTNGLWRDADWIGCTDGKRRPVEPGTFPLAHGATARVGRLRAYGNAIVAQAAEAVIRAYMS